MLTLVSLEIGRRVGVVLAELFNNVLADVAVVLLDSTSDNHLIFRRDDGRLPAFSEKVLHKLTDITPSNRDMLDSRSDYVSFGLRGDDLIKITSIVVQYVAYNRNDVGHTISRVNDGSSESSIRHLVRRPRRSKGEDGLNRDIQTSDIKGLEEDLRSRLAILWGIQRGFGLIANRNIRIYM